MIITKLALPRRTFLRGIGAAVALPLLDAMVPALSAASRTAATPARRLGFVYIPNGAIMDQWTPVGDGKAFEFAPIMKSLDAHREQVVVVSNLASRPAATVVTACPSTGAALFTFIRNGSLVAIPTMIAENRYSSRAA